MVNFRRLKWRKDQEEMGRDVACEPTEILVVARKVAPVEAVAVAEVQEQEEKSELSIKSFSHSSYSACMVRSCCLFFYRRLCKDIIQVVDERGLLWLYRQMVNRF